MRGGGGSLGFGSGHVVTFSSAAKWIQLPQEVLISCDI